MNWLHEWPGFLFVWFPLAALVCSAIEYARDWTLGKIYTWRTGKNPDDPD